MSKIAALLTLLVAVLTCGLLAAPAQAQRARVFVASYGSDTNPCTFGSPCKTFQHAHDTVAAGGEITAIDSAGFGPVMITKAVTITSPNGVEAGIAAAANADAIDITAQSGDVVSLNGLTLDGAGAANNGIVFSGGSALEITNSVARNFRQSGLAFDPTEAATFKATNSEFNGNSTQGIAIAPLGTGLSISGTLDHVGFYNNGVAGLNAVGNSDLGGLIDIAVKDSVMSNNGSTSSGAGVAAQTSTNRAATRIMLVRCVLNSNPWDGILSSGPGAQVVVTDSSIFNNNHAWLASTSGQIFSYGNNAVFDNIDDQGPQTAATPE